MASGSAYGWTDSTHTIRFYVYWEAEADEPNNRSEVTVWGKLYRPDNYDYTYDSDNHNRVRFYVDGVLKVDYSDFEYYVQSLTNGKDGYLHRGSSTGTYKFSFYISHDATGKFENKSIKAIFTSPINTGSYIDAGVDVVAEDTDATFDVIPRGSVINSVSNFNLEDSFSVSVTKYSSSFTDTLAIKYGGTTIKTITGYTSGASINLSDTEILTAYNALGTNTSGTFTFNLTTKSGSTTIGTDSDTATGTARGTMQINVNGVWKRAVPHINVGGTWKRCVVYFNDNGNWERGIG